MENSILKRDAESAIEDLVTEIERLEEKVKQLEHFKDTSVGLWCIDFDPNQSDFETICKNAFQLTD